MMRNSNKEAFRKRLSKQSLWSKPWFYVILLLAIVIIALLVYQIPAVNNRLSWRVESATSRIYYFFNRPGRDVFVPVATEANQENVAKTMTAAVPPTLTPTVEPTITPTLEFTPTPTIEPTATPTPKPLPRSVLLEGVRWNTKKPIIVVLPTSRCY